MFEEIWAKTGKDGVPDYPLLAHLLDAASAMTAVWSQWLRPGLRQMLEEELGDNALEVAMFAAGVHDIGKANPVFSGQVAAKRDAESARIWEAMRKRLREEGYEGTNISPHTAQESFLRRHEQVGAAHFVEDKPGWSESDACDEWLPLVVMGHHGRFALDYGYMPEGFRHVQGKWGEARLYLEQAVEKACGISKSQLPQRVSVPAIILLSGMVILADRLASTDESIVDAKGLLASGKLSLQSPREWVEKRSQFFADLLSSTLGTYQGFSDPTEEILGPYRARGPQVGALDVAGGLWLVMAATGSGKTEASLLRHAAWDESLTLLLPTQAVTNAQMRRLREIFASTGNTAALAHGMAALEEFYDVGLADENGVEFKDADQTVGARGLFPTDFVSRGSARLLASVTVGTIDQALMASLPLKWTHLRLLALANSHVVVDEAHTLDEYQQELACVLLHWLGATNTRVTLLSATMDSRRRQKFLRAYSGQEPTLSPPAFPATELVASRRQNSHDSSTEVAVTELEMEPYSLSLDLVDSADTCADHIAWAKKLRTQYPKSRLGIVTNQINRAQEIARALADAGQEVLVLHSRMTAQHRVENAQALEDLLGPAGTGEGITVVGTQAIEAALDIDLDALSIDMAPASSIIQRAGRGWRRHDDARSDRVPGMERLPLRVVAGTHEGWHLPYLASPLNRAHSWLAGRTELMIPDDLQELVETEVRRAGDKTVQSDLEEWAKGSLERQAAGGWSKQIQQAMDPDALAIDFSGLTFVETDDDEFPATRFIESDSARVILLDPNGTIPGGWGGTLEDLRNISKGRGNGDRVQSKLRQAMGASIQISSSLLKRMQESGGEFAVLADGPKALKGVLIGSLPDNMFYDPLVGLRGA